MTITRVTVWHPMAHISEAAHIHNLNGTDWPACVKYSNLNTEIVLIAVIVPSGSLYCSGQRRAPTVLALVE